MTLAHRLAPLGMVEIPIWVFDFDNYRMCWANARALELWNAADADEFYARDLTDMSAAARMRLDLLIASAREGRPQSAEDWTFYPRNQPVTVRVHLSIVPLDDGRDALLGQALVKHVAPDPTRLRAADAVQHTAAMVALLAQDETLLMQNPASVRAFGSGAPFRSWFVDSAVAPAILRAAEAGEVFSGEVVARTTEGERWHAVEARRTKDPANGADALLLHHTDVTVLAEQRRQIVALSAPILDIGERVLAVPIVGAVSTARSEEIAARLLPAIVERRAEHVILDWTGVDALDHDDAAGIAQMVSGVRLLGARLSITGVRPALARALVAANIDLGGVPVLPTLGEGLAATRR